MRTLAVANILHRKLRSSLSAMGVMIGIGSLITMLALSHGTLSEVARRVKGIDAQLVVLPSRSSLIFSAGAPLSDKYIPRIQSARIDGKRIVEEVIPVYLSFMPAMAGQQHRIFAIRKEDFSIFTKDRKIVAGRIFDKGDEFHNYVKRLRKKNKGRYNPDDVPEDVLNGACEFVIDSRLARAGGYKVGDKVSFLGREFRICGIVEAGGAARIFASIDVIRHIENGGLRWSSLFFVRLKPGLPFSEEECSSAIRKVTHLRVEPLSKYDRMLFDSFRSVYVYINIASGLVLIVSFLFIMVTIYTMVLERRREIGILRSMGADGVYIMGQTILEALIISTIGTVGGIVLSFIAKWIIEYYRPLLTVDITVRWIVLAVVVGVVGGIISAFWPGIKAVREDPVEAIAYE